MMIECYLYFNVWNDESKSLFECLRAIRSPKIKLLLSDGVCNFWKGTNYAGYFARDIIVASKEKGTFFDCYMWNVLERKVDPLYGEDIRGLINIMANNQNIPFCVINNSNYPKGIFTLFRDGTHLSEYPDAFYKLTSFTSSESVLEYLRSKHIIRKFSLNGNDDFELLEKHHVQGASVFRQKSSGYLWYLDNLHKTHYEVFDSRGKKHIGEADIEGKLDSTRKDSTKQPIL